MHNTINKLILICILWLFTAVSMPVFGSVASNKWQELTIQQLQNDLQKERLQKKIIIVIGSFVYIVLFVLVVIDNRRRVLLLHERMEKIKGMQYEHTASTTQKIKDNQLKIEELERLLQKLGDENSVLKLQLEERKETLNLANSMAIVTQEKREQAETLLFSSDVYMRIKNYLNVGHSMNEADWKELAQLVNGVYYNFTEKLYSLYKLSTQDYRVCLLIKIRLQPKEIAILTDHSKESVATTRSRLYFKIFGKKGSTRDWDDFILSI